MAPTECGCGVPLEPFTFSQPWNGAVLDLSWEYCPVCLWRTTPGFELRGRSEGERLTLTESDIEGLL